MALGVAAWSEIGKEKDGNFGGKEAWGRGLGWASGSEHSSWRSMDLNTRRSFYHERGTESETDRTALSAAGRHVTASLCCQQPQCWHESGNRVSMMSGMETLPGSSQHRGLGHCGWSSYLLLPDIQPASSKEQYRDLTGHRLLKRPRSHLVASQLHPEKGSHFSLLKSVYIPDMGLNFPLVGPQPSPVFTEHWIHRLGIVPADQGPL